MKLGAGATGDERWEADPWAGLETRGVLPHSLLDTIPSGDLGESLDTRRPGRADQAGEETRSAPVSAHSLGEHQRLNEKH